MVPPRTLWAGVPGKAAPRTWREDRKLILQYAQNYLDYTKIYLTEAKSKSRIEVSFIWLMAAAQLASKQTREQL